jgi:plastocyanin
MNARPPLFSAGSFGAWSRSLRLRGYCAATVATMLVATSLLAATVHTISQKSRDFSRDQITINRGDSILFTNEDEFFHQIYVKTAGMTFDSNEQAPGQTIEVNFPRSGDFAVRCHIHPKMLLTVRIE